MTAKLRLGRNFYLQYFNIEKNDWSDASSFVYRDRKTALLNYKSYRRRNPNEAVRLISGTGNIFRIKKNITLFFKEKAKSREVV